MSYGHVFLLVIFSLLFIIWHIFFLIMRLFTTRVMYKQLSKDLPVCNAILKVTNPSFDSVLQIMHIPFKFSNRNNRKNDVCRCTRIFTRRSNTIIIHYIFNWTLFHIISGSREVENLRSLQVDRQKDRWMQDDRQQEIRKTHLNLQFSTKVPNLLIKFVVAFSDSLKTF